MMPHACSTFYSEKFQYTICETSISNWARSIRVRRRGRISAKFIARFHRVRCKSFSRGESSTIRFDIRGQTRSISSRDILALSSPVEGIAGRLSPRGFRIKCYKLQRRARRFAPMIAANIP